MTNAPVRTARIIAVGATVLGVAPAVAVYLFLAAVPTMLIPITIAALPVFGTHARGLRILSYTASGLMAVWAFISGFTVGYLFLPSALAFLIAGHRAGVAE